MEEMGMSLSDFAATEQPQPPKRVSTMRVVLVQSICCAALVLFFALFKVCGGSAYTQLKNAFHKALENNALMTTVAQLLDDTPVEEYVVSNDTTVTTVPTDEG